MRLKMVISLTWTLINSHYNIPRSIYHFRRRERLWEPALIAGVIVLMVVMLGPLYGMLMDTMYTQYEAAGIIELFLANPDIMANLFGLVFGVFLMVSIFFFGEDMRVLVSLPLKSTEVLLAKFFVVLLDLMIISLVIVLPPYIYFGIRSGAGFMYWPFMIVAFLLSQVLPLLVSAIIILPLSRVLRFNRHRDSLVYFVSVGVVVAALAFVFVSSRMDPNMSPEDFARMFSDKDALLNKTAGVYPPTILVMRALTRPVVEGFLWLLAFVGLHLAALGGFLWLGNRFYYSIYSSLQENYARRSKLNEGEVAGLMGRQSTPFGALLRREWWYFLKVPAFTFNGFGNVIIFPILLVIAAVAGQTDELGQMIKILENYREIFLPMGILVATLAGGINGLATSIFSREGKLIEELKTLPVGVSEIMKAKFIHVETLSMIGPLSAAIALGIIMKISLLEGLLIFAIGALAVTFLNMIQMLIDVVRPYLHWDNPQKAMKQNLNVALSIPVVFGFVGGLGYLTYLLRNTLSGWVMALMIAAICVAGTVALWPVLMRRAKALLDRDLSLS